MPGFDPSLFSTVQTALGEIHTHPPNEMYLYSVLLTLPSLYAWLLVKLNLS